MPKMPLRARNTMPHELWPNCILAMDQLPSRSRVSSLCRSLRRQPSTSRILLLGPVSDHGFCSVDVPRKPSRYRSVSSLPAGKAVPHRLPRSGISFDAADANENRDWRIFADFAQVLIGMNNIYIRRFLVHSVE